VAEDKSERGRRERRRARKEIHCEEILSHSFFAIE
jgi:hypothetical protein